MQDLAGAGCAGKKSGLPRNAKARFFLYYPGSLFLYAILFSYQ